MWYVYLLLCSNKSVYTGITTDIERRVKQHNKGTASKYTRSRRPVTLIKYFKVNSKSEALRLEYKIKQLSKKHKLLL